MSRSMYRKSRRGLAACAVVGGLAGAAHAQTMSDQANRTLGSRVTTQDGIAVDDDRRVLKRLATRIDSRLRTRIDPLYGTQTDLSSSYTPKADDGAKGKP